MNERIAIGQVARDKVTGFEGRITGKASYITGCDQYLLAPKVTDKGDMKRGEWFDEHRLEVIDAQVMELVASLPERGGADTPAPAK
jgi:hypothetical protein